MLLALHVGNKDLVAVLIKNGADINTPALNVRNITTQFTLIRLVPLICISIPYIICILHCFVQKGDTPLIAATKKGMIDFVKLLLDHSADSSSKDKVSNRRM